MKYAVCTLDELQATKPFITKVKDIEIGVYLDNDKAYAVRNICPHKLAPVCKGTVGGTMLPSDPCEYNFGLEGQVLKCPWHGWEFDLHSGQALFGITNKKVRTYPAFIEDNQIFVEM